MALEERHPEVTGSATQQALDGLVKVLREVAGQKLVAAVGPPDTPLSTRPDVLVTPLSLNRVGRSRRAGALLDLELAVAVEVGGPDVLGLTERLLAVAERTSHARVEPLPADRPGFGFVITLPVSVTVTEPSGPPVSQVVVESLPLVAVTGTVVDAGGVAQPGVEVQSNPAHLQTTTDAAGRFALAVLAPTTLTIARGDRAATFEVPPVPTELRLILPNHQGG